MKPIPKPNNRLQGTGTLKVREASKVLFRSGVLRKRGPAPEPGVRRLEKEGGSPWSSK